MKLIDEKGKLFGRVNIIDLLVVLLIIAAIIFVAVKLGFNASKAEDTDIEFVIEILQVRDVTYDAICANLNDVYAVNDPKQILGDIINIEKIPARELTLLDNGEYAYAEYFDRYDVRVTIKTQSEIKDKGYYIAGGIQILIGDAITFSNGYAETSGEIISITEK